MKKLRTTLLLLLFAVATIACPVCERNQPKILKGIMHGASPESKWDYMIVCTIVAAVLLTIFFSIKWLIYPSEKSESHIKRFILNDE